MQLNDLVEKAQKIVGYTDGGYTEIKALDQEKFASLIIEECHEIIVIGGVDDLDAVKKQFGIEE